MIGLLRIYAYALRFEYLDISILRKAEASHFFQGATVC